MLGEYGVVVLEAGLVLALDEPVPDVEHLVVFDGLTLVLLLLLSNQFLFDLDHLIVLFDGVLLEVTHVVVYVKQGNALVDILLHVLGELFKHLNEVSKVD